MSITTDFNAWWAELSDYSSSNAAKAEFQEVMANIDQSLDKLQQMNASGQFNKLPESWKTKALWAWQILNTARNTIKADAAFMEGLTWRP